MGKLKRRAKNLGGLLQEPLKNISVEGITTFLAPPAKYYRYVIELKSSKMSIWIEDRTSKKQWFKGGMAETDYVSNTNAIPNASAADYVKCFQDTLDCELEASSDVQRKLSPLNGGAVRLEVGVAIRVLRATCMAKYTFDLDSVSVERIDMLESKLRDQQEDLEKLRGELNWCAFAKLTATTVQNEEGSIMCWSAFESDVFISNGLDGTIKILRRGVYSIGVVGTQNQQIELLKNAILIQVAYPGYSQGCICSTTLYTIEH